MCARNLQRGFTLIELALGGAITAFLLTGVAGLLVSTNGVAQRSHANLSASLTNRRSLERLADLMRGAATTSLAGFNAAGVATAPVFQIVTGLNAGNPVLSLPYTLQWQAVVASTPGITNPGEIVKIQGGVSTRIAANVPAGGFSVTQLGTSVRIHLSTYALMADGETALVSDDAMVCLRN
jgi:hypothetical protein